ncbi:hypothetical protein C8A05DRAFT_40024, partial [Staphylotrichum tortipilum]
MWEGVKETTAEDRSADADAQQLRALADAYLPELAPGINNPEPCRNSRRLLIWLSQNYADASHYRARTWGYTILRTTYGNDAAFDAAVGTLARYMRAKGDQVCWWTAENLGSFDIRSSLPEGATLTPDPRPSDKLYVHRFVNEAVQDREALENATPTQACTFFRRWALERWDGEEKYFSAAGPRLKTVILFDDETVVQLQSLAAHEFAGENPGKEASDAGAGFWVKMVEAEPKQRDLNQGLLEWFRVGFWDLANFWFDRDITEPA